MKKFLFWKVVFPTLIIISPSIILLIFKLFNKRFLKGVIELVLDHKYGEHIRQDMLDMFGVFMHLFICIILIYFILKLFRKRNKNKIFNREDGYYDIPYFIFFYAAKILNYQSISLINVPIEMQYRLVLNRTFEKFEVGNYKEITNNIEEQKLFLNKDSDEINLLLSDTYPLDTKKIPNTKRKLPTYIIQSRKKTDGVRIYNQHFVEHIKKVVSELSKNYNRVNIFSYTNPKHNYEIINSCFRTGNRSGFSKVYVYKAEKPKYTFESGVRVK